MSKDDVYFRLLGLLVVAYPFLQIIAVHETQGRWRRAALAPLILAGLALAGAIFAVVFPGPQSFLTPLLLTILLIPFGSLYLAIFIAVKGWKRRSGTTARSDVG